MKLTGYKDYIDEVYNEFPDVDKASIRSIVRHGLGMLHFFQRNGHDTYLNNNREDKYYYFGDTSHDMQKRWAISLKKTRKKMRLVHSLKKIPFEGVYYFGLTDEQYEQHLKGLPIDLVFMYRLEEETKIKKANTHFFKEKVEGVRSWKLRKENYETTNAEYIQ